MTGSREKIISIDEAAKKAGEARAEGVTIVLCHGCFDIVHPGHIRHLEQAAKLGDRLLVTVSDDPIVDKGHGRPLIPQELRAENLAALDCVDWVAVSNRPTAVELLSEIQPDVYVKGREYEHNRDPRFEHEKQIVQQYGGRVIFTSGDVVFSSTSLIRSIEETVNPAHAALRSLIDRHTDDADSIEVLIESFRGKRVLVVGETIIDTYVMCDRPEVAGESPVMTLRPVEYRSFEGGAAIIAKHLAAMGAKPTLLTALPRSGRSHSVQSRVESAGVDLHGFEVDGRCPEKQRFLVGSSKVIKVDLGEPLVLDAADRQRFTTTATELAQSCDGLIIADFGLGLLTAPMLSDLCEKARPAVDFMAGDVSGRRSNLTAMRHMDLLCPSEVELRDALHDYEQGLSAVVWRLLNQTESAAAIVTLGDDGLITFDHRPGIEAAAADWASRLRAEHIPSPATHAVDQLGCGDATLAAATLALMCGSSVPVAGLLGSLAGAAEAGKLGNAVIGAADLRRGLRALRETHLTFDPEHSPTVVTPRNDQLPASHPRSS